MAVGKSGLNTPPKHATLDALVTKEIFAGNNIDKIGRFVLLDMTAGDSIPLDDQEWERGSSPAILTRLAKEARKPTLSVHWEVQPNTYRTLIDRFAANLIGPGWSRPSYDRWTFGDLVVVRAINASGGTGFDPSQLRPSDSVYLINDPNAITTWAMQPGFAAAIEGRTRWFRSMSTMGCNVNGISRLSTAERAKWYELLREQEETVPRNRDLYLFARVKDANKWGYLLSEAVRWRRPTERQVDKVFEDHGQFVEGAWFKTDRARYEEIKDQLFMTRKERGVA